ncbi:MAG: hypothetical protein CMD74_03295 [Gammaproteobacteria bacterium]|nr:hypothetical protein [Gammaproteobacteria bacterium]
MSNGETLKPARLSTKNGVPYSINFGDIYHDPDFKREVEKVLLDPSNLTSMKRQVSILRVGELGFGTGLNLAAVAKTCRANNQPLHFVSCDQFPIHKSQFSRIAKKRLGQYPFYSELIDAYPPLIKGWHRRHFKRWDITISLYWGSVHGALQDLQEQNSPKFNAWFLDGFSPAKNPEMWDFQIMSKIGALSKKGTTVATFTSAGQVRRNLEEVGFKMRPVDQQPNKRESLAGVYNKKGLPKRPSCSSSIILGAGLAGATLARQLAERGLNVAVFDKGKSSAGGASKIPISMLHSRLLSDSSSSAKLRCHAYQYSIAQMNQAGVKPEGAIQIPDQNTPLSKLVKLANLYSPTGDWIQLINSKKAESLTKWNISSSALWFPYSRMIEMPKLCRHLLDHPNIKVSYGADIQLKDIDPDIPTTLACANAYKDFTEAHFLEVQATEGQIDIVSADEVPAIPIVGSSYLMPKDNQLYVGSTYETTAWKQGEATKKNREALKKLNVVETKWLGKWRASRCSSSDRIPVVGKLVDHKGQHIRNLYASLAMGSMGNIFSHFAAEIIASQICNDFPPLTSGLLEEISPLRFRKRQKRRGYRLQAKP